MSSENDAIYSSSPVVGINFGNSYASIAVISPEGLAECIANEDGERQIAAAVSFHGEQIYVGNQAKHQLLKNAKNTIVGFRNLLGKKFSDVYQARNPSPGAPIVQHPTIPDSPAYIVASSSPEFSSDVEGQPKIDDDGNLTLTPLQVNTIFLKSLIQSASDYLGYPVTKAVISVPPAFTPTQKEALREAALAAGIARDGLNLLGEAGAIACVTTSLPSAGEYGLGDRTQLQVDLGASGVTLSLLNLRAGLATLLGTYTSTEEDNLGTDHIDANLVDFFSKDFTKKTKTPITKDDTRAQTLFALHLPLTKRTLSASPSPASISIESIKDGLDYTGSVNRMRFGMIVKDVYTAISDKIKSLLSKADVDPTDIKEVVFVGGGGCLPGLEEALLVQVGLDEDINQGTIKMDPTEVIARGCAIQGSIIDSIHEAEEELKAAYRKAEEDKEIIDCTGKTVGILVPSDSEDEESVNKELGGVWLPILVKGTPLPARRVISFDVKVNEAGEVGVEIWEVDESIKVEMVKIPPPPPSSDDEDDEPAEEEEEEVRTRVVSKSAYLGALKLKAELAIEKEKQQVSKTTVRVEIVAGPNRQLDVSVAEDGQGGAKGTLQIPARS